MADYRFVIVDSQYKRVRKKNGQPIEPFEYPKQAEVYIDKYLGGSPYLKIHSINHTIPVQMIHVL